MSARRRRTRWVALLAVAVAATTGCERTGSAEPPVDTIPKPGAATYADVIVHLFGEPDEPPDPLPILYLVSLDEPLGIDEQALIIEALSLSFAVRFVDDLAAAVLGDEPGRPPRDDAIVLGLGPIDAEPPHRLRVEQYRADDDIEAALFTVEYGADRWVVITAEPVPAEVLTDAA